MGPGRQAWWLVQESPVRPGCRVPADAAAPSRGPAARTAGLLLQAGEETAHFTPSVPVQLHGRPAPLLRPDWSMYTGVWKGSQRCLVWLGLWCAADPLLILGLGAAASLGDVSILITGW